MITRLLRIQLVLFVLLSCVGVAYVGIRYVRVDTLIHPRTYQVVVSLAESGGIFTGADATYRGVSVGRVDDMVLTSQGVDVHVVINPDAAPIPADTEVVIANKSAVGEQYLDFQPRTADGPYLRAGSRVAQEHTRIPIDTKTLLTDVDTFVASVDTDDLRTVLHELGVAFGEGSGQDLRTIIDTSTSFITTADDKFEVTAALIREATAVLDTQIAARSDITRFAEQLALLTDTFRTSDADLRTVLDEGAPTARLLRNVIAENAEEIGRLVRNLIRTNRAASANLPGIKGVFVLAPYALEGAYSIITKDPVTGLYGARFSVAIQPHPEACSDGFLPESQRRDPHQRSPRSITQKTQCTQPEADGNNRGADDVPASGRTSPKQSRSTDFGPLIATYDTKTESLTATTPAESGRGVADMSMLGKDSWKWLVLGPAATQN